MRKIIFLAVGIFIGSNVKAQDTLSVKAGVLVAPMGGISLQNPKEGFQTFVPVILLVSFTKGKNTVTPQYNMSANAVGLRFSHDFTEKLTAYALCLKNLKDKGGYAGTGIETPIINKNAFLFIELDFGTGSKDKYTLKPTFFCGAFIPLKIKVK